MTTAWILIANASEACLYESPKAKLLNGDAQLTRINEYGHPESRMKVADLVSDKQGHSGHGTMVESTAPKKVEAEHFAIELAEILESGRVQHKYDELIVAAPAHFQGLLRQHLNQHVTNMWSVNIDKDYTKVEPSSLVGQLQTHL